MEGIQGLLQAGGLGDISPDMIQGLIDAAGGAGGLGDLGNLADLAGGFGGEGGANAIIQMIQAQLGDQLSAEDINMLLGTLSQSGLGGGGRSRPGGAVTVAAAVVAVALERAVVGELTVAVVPGGGRGEAGGRTGGRDIRDLANEREARNQDWKDR